jgi:hypothetical protein
LDGRRTLVSEQRFDTQARKADKVKIKFKLFFLGTETPDFIHPLYRFSEPSWSTDLE